MNFRPIIRRHVRARSVTTKPLLGFRFVTSHRSVTSSVWDSLDMSRWVSSHRVYGLGVPTMQSDDLPRVIIRAVDIAADILATVEI